MDVDDVRIPLISYYSLLNSSTPPTALPKIIEPQFSFDYCGSYQLAIHNF
jgi:hypothetical protein